MKPRIYFDMGVLFDWVHMYNQRNIMLIDDRQITIDGWVSAGGAVILFK